VLGRQRQGQLGSGDRTSRAEPRQVTLPAKAVDVRTAFEFTCAVLADASAWCWGYNWEGSSDSATRTRRGSPGADPARQHARLDVRRHRPGTRLRHPLAGSTLLLGPQHESQLGQGDTRAAADSARPSGRQRRRTGMEVGCSQSTTCARKRDGSLWCWGAQASGALAVGDVTARPTPAQVPTYSDWSA
jgi:alpha-tubulin suppressor-like RCC1 family protein